VATAQSTLKSLIPHGGTHSDGVAGGCGNGDPVQLEEPLEGLIIAADVDFRNERSESNHRFDFVTACQLLSVRFLIEGDTHIKCL
jgi:hypothetical protein